MGLLSASPLPCSAGNDLLGVEMESTPLTEDDGVYKDVNDKAGHLWKVGTKELHLQPNGRPFKYKLRPKLGMYTPEQVIHNKWKSVQYTRAGLQSSVRFCTKDTCARSTGVHLGGSANNAALLSGGQILHGGLGNFEVKFQETVGRGRGSASFELEIPFLRKKLQARCRRHDIFAFCNEVVVGVRITGEIETTDDGQHVDHGVNGQVTSQITRCFGSRQTVQGGRSLAINLTACGDVGRELSKKTHALHEVIDVLQTKWKDEVERKPELWEVLRVHVKAADVNNDLEELERKEALEKVWKAALELENMALGLRRVAGC